MKLSVDRVAETPTEHHFVADAQWWQEWTGAGEDYAYTVSEWPRFDLRARAHGEDLVLEGHLKAAIDVECSRCLKRYRQGVDGSFGVTLEPIRDRQPPDPESVEMLERFGLYLGDELDLGWYRGKEILVDPLLAEATALAMPFQPVCHDGCKGLCPQCGVDRNQASCDCRDQRPESPFAALAVLRKDAEESS